MHLLQITTRNYSLKPKNRVAQSASLAYTIEMKFALGILILGCVLALGLGYYFIQDQEHGQTVTDQEDPIEVSEKAGDINAIQPSLDEKQAQTQEVQAVSKYITNDVVTPEAQLSAAERQARVDQLNDTLAHRIEAGKQAEQAATELEDQIQNLIKSMQTANRSFAASSGQQQIDPEVILAEQKKRIEELKRQQDEIGELNAKLNKVLQEKSEIYATQLKLRNQIAAEGDLINVPDD